MASEIQIQRKHLWQSIGNLTEKDWMRAVPKLGFELTQPSGGSSHYSVRFKGFEKEDIKGLVTNVYKGMRKDVHEKVFKAMIKIGECKEDDIWIALGMMKGKFSFVKEEDTEEVETLEPSV